ncbi:cupin domain-containing protein [Rhizomicrobium electricum]|jgi:quercetin dioxygenase-like cupin family protein|uniref:1-methylthio-xylulose 5-phosphate sulfo-lyase n=1 Tax=Rhizomicrobium electricum TaxID=480070 RepID=A0ABP3Q0K4_9PROT|nr:cupin domain-containing protein [Rhizomicrobium electricum]NIJ50130.1 quercetin dioxygenase-like cupin family protein [Rhizomicrobium electricum]
MTGPVRRFSNYRWENTDLLAYKEEGSAPFKAITRQTLFRHPELKGELRYFEMAAGGYSTLERHQHVHAVLILRGKGQCMLGGEVFDIGENDLVTIEPMTWHQFRANAGEPMGFLCMVNVDRDKPQLPTEGERDELAEDPKVKAFFGL